MMKRMKRILSLTLALILLLALGMPAAAESAEEHDLIRRYLTGNLK